MTCESKVRGVSTHPREPGTPHVTHASLEQVAFGQKDFLLREKAKRAKTSFCELQCERKAECPGKALQMKTSLQRGKAGAAPPENLRHKGWRRSSGWKTKQAEGRGHANFSAGK